MEKEKQVFHVIPSVRDIKYLKRALQCPSEAVLLSGAHIGNLRQLTDACHKEGKKVIVNHELVAGLASDKTAMQMLKKHYHVDGIIGSSPTKLHMMRGLDVKVIYRISLMDSLSVDSALRSLRETHFDAVELRPYYHAIEFLPQFKKVFSGDYYIAGFVNNEEKIRKCMEAGFVSTMTSSRDLWNLNLGQKKGEPAPRNN